MRTISLIGTSLLLWVTNVANIGFASAAHEIPQAPPVPYVPTTVQPTLPSFTYETPTISYPDSPYPSVETEDPYQTSPSATPSHEIPTESGPAYPPSSSIETPDPYQPTPTTMSTHESPLHEIPTETQSDSPSSTPIKTPEPYQPTTTTTSTHEVPNEIPTDTHPSYPPSSPIETPDPNQPSATATTRIHEIPQRGTLSTTQPSISSSSSEGTTDLPSPTLNHEIPADPLSTYPSSSSTGETDPYSQPTITRTASHEIPVHEIPVTQTATSIAQPTETPIPSLPSRPGSKPKKFCRQFRIGRAVYERCCEIRFISYVPRKSRTKYPKPSTTYLLTPSLPQPSQYTSVEPSSYPQSTFPPGYVTVTGSEGVVVEPDVAYSAVE
ncbi:uncharacterized protein VTP21DRAFT_580 [Calcarisporiella thermophila]|uniref:uncharacterized protein n=1 Tax=Calcarisporiella thermophila TaxID=911321 RepID=UPI003742EF99